MQDQIQREIIINASKERVYAAITSPNQLTQWFPDRIEGTISEGEHPLFVFEGHGKAQVFIEAMQPYAYFAYRWIPGGSDFLGDVRTVPHTLVEFKIEEVGQSCKLILTESGFATLPSDVAEKKYTQNDGGWTFMIGRLDAYFKK